jgi:hypothetical protein
MYIVHSPCSKGYILTAIKTKKKDKVGQKNMWKGQARRTTNGKGHWGFLYSEKWLNGRRRIFPEIALELDRLEPKKLLLSANRKFALMQVKLKKIELLKGHGNEADFLGFLHKSVPHESLALPFKPFWFYLQIRGDIHNRKRLPNSPSQGVDKIAYRYNFFQTFK